MEEIRSTVNLGEVKWRPEIQMRHLGKVLNVILESRAPACLKYHAQHLDVSCDRD
jgi:hypothetical protein